MSSLVFTAFGKTFHLYNDTGADVWAYSYCKAEDNNYRTEDRLEVGKKDFYMSDSIFLCNPIKKISFSLVKGSPSLFIDRGVNSDEEISIIKDSNGNLAVKRGASGSRAYAMQSAAATNRGGWVFRG